MKKMGAAFALAAGMAMCATPGWAQESGAGRAIVTVQPARGSEPATVTVEGLKAKVNGREARVTGWRPLRGGENPLELVVLIDGAARTSLGNQLDDIAHFVREAPSNAKVAIGYMLNGRAVLAGPLTGDASEALKGLHIPSGTAGSNGSPYFCLTDLAGNWPSTDSRARREVVLISDGVDGYLQPPELDDPYVQAAIRDAVKARLVVDAVYWTSRGDGGSDSSNLGESLLMEVTNATGGDSYWQGTGNPVSLEPFFTQLRRRLENQWALEFQTQLDGKAEMETLKVQVEGRARLTAPREVWVEKAAGQ